MNYQTVKLLEAQGVTKRFGSVVANRSVDLAIERGQIHALLGENGAGKSTLVKMLYGLLQPDDGRLVWDGTPRRIASPKQARALGIGMVFQHFSLFETMTVLENVALGLDQPGRMADLAKRVRSVSRCYGLPLEPDRLVGSLSTGERQRIEIVRCLLQEPQLLILDEPTAVLTPQEADRLFETLRRLAEAGCAVLYISHKLREIRTLCDRATILRGGSVVGACDPRAVGISDLAAMMIGAEIRSVSVQQPVLGPVRLAVEGLSLPAPTELGVALTDIAFAVQAGEIFGIAGVAGNGQGELAAALSGERRCLEARTIALDGEPIGRMTAAERRRAGLCALPEERNGHAAIPSLTLSETALLTGHQRNALVRSGMIDAAATTTMASDIIRKFDVRASGVTAEAGSLSGGNLQKFIVGREVLQAPRVLVVAQPTWGVDAGAAAIIHQALITLAAGGVAILVISQDLDELLGLCGRIAVINTGRLSPAMTTDGISLDRLGLLMGGIHGEAPSIEIESLAHAD